VGVKPLEMPDNEWTEEDKALVCRVLWGEPEVVASNNRRTAILMRKFTAEIGGEDE
jgi:hypothetical protein